MHLWVTKRAVVSRCALLAVFRTLLTLAGLLIQVQAGLTLVASAGSIVAIRAFLNIAWLAIPSIFSEARSTNVALL